MLVIDNLETVDAFSVALTLESKFGGRLVYVVANQSVKARFRPLVEHGGSDTADYGPEILLTPQSSFIDKISGAQFRSAIAGTPARVVAQLSEPGDVLPASGTPFTGTLFASGGTSDVGVGDEVAYQEFTANVAITATTEATADLVVTAPSFAADGISFYIVEIFAPFARPDPAAVADLFVILRDDTAAVSLGRIAQKQNSAANKGYTELNARRRLSPSAGARVYSIRAFMSAAASGLVSAGVGGSGVLVPGFVRIVKAT